MNPTPVGPAGQGCPAAAPDSPDRRIALDALAASYRASAEHAEAEHAEARDDPWRAEKARRRLHFILLSTQEEASA